MTLGISMEDGNIDYGRYSSRELTEALGNIDKRKCPRNFQNLQKEIAARPPQGEPVAAISDEPVASRGTKQSTRTAMIFRYTLMSFAVSVSVGIATGTFRYAFSSDTPHVWGVVDAIWAQRIAGQL